MRRSPSIEPFTPSPNVQLHPTLQAVLDSLDVQIEAELIRYRRQRRHPNARPQRQVRPPDPTALGILQQSIQLPTLRSSLYEATEAPMGQAVDPTTGQTISRTGGQPGSRADGALPQAFQPTARPAAPANAAPNQAGVAVWSAAPTPRPAPVVGSAHPGAAGAASNRALTNAVPQPSLDAPGLHPASAAELAPAEMASAEIASYANQYDLSAYAPNSTLQRLMHQAGMASAGSLQAQALQAQALQTQTATATADETVEAYLASSEELLRSIAEESRQPADQEPNSLLDTLLTPLGVGSMLLLLLTSTTLGYVMMNPASVGLPHGIGASGSWADGNSASNGASSAPSSQPAPTAAQTMRGPAADQALPSPNLAADEFVDLGLDTLSTIPRAKGQRPQPATGPKPAGEKSAQAAGTAASPTARSTAGATGTTEPLARSVEPPATVVMPTVVDSSRLPELPAKPPAPPRIETVVVPARPPISEAPPAVSTTLAPVSPEPIRTAPPPIQPAPLPPVEPAPSMATVPQAEANPDRYYVVTDYSGDASLEAARTAVPDAYVRNLPNAGAKVQLGSFNDEAGAEGLRQQLQQQGIEAEVYRP